MSRNDAADWAGYGEERKALKERVRVLESQLETALDEHAEGAWMARALDAEASRDRAVEYGAKLREEVDRYDMACTRTRNVLTAAGVPEITGDRLYTMRLWERAEWLVERESQTHRLGEQAREQAERWAADLERYDEEWKAVRLVLEAAGVPETAKTGDRALSLVRRVQILVHRAGSVIDHGGEGES